MAARLPLEQGQQAAQRCFINLLAQLKAACDGDLDRVRRVVRLGGFIACTPEFTRHAEVMNGASDLAVAVFGDIGRHARSTIGVPSLPLDAAVEVEGLFEILSSAGRSRCPPAVQTSAHSATAAIHRLLPYRPALAPHTTPDNAERDFCLMPDGSAALSLTLHGAIADIPAAEWDACAGAATRSSVTPSWRRWKTAARPTRAPAGCRATPRCATPPAPCWRSRRCTPSRHSYGEYVFDHGWANALERAGGDYYPKLQVAVPFSPVPGPRLLLRPEAGVAVGNDGRGAGAGLPGDGPFVGARHFCTEPEWSALGKAGWLQRLGMQFHWENAGYASFEDFLGVLSSRKRKVLRRERRDANAAGLTFQALNGADLKERALGCVLPLLHLHRGPQMGQSPT